MTIQINGTTGISGVDGSASTPALQGSDTNTGISFGTDEVAINTNGTQRAVVDSSGRLLVGTSSARSNYLNSSIYSGLLQVEGTENSSRVISFVHNTTDGAQPFIVLGKTRGSTAGSNTVVQDADGLGTISFQGSDGTELVEGARIQGNVDGTPGANDMPGRLVFSTTSNGASSPTERMRITQAGTTVFYNSAFVYPATDNATNLGGGANFRWSAVWAANGTIQTSDQRAKTEITEATLGSEFVKALRPVSYKWVEGGKHDTGERDKDGNYVYESIPGTRTHWGFIAQEVKDAVDAAGVDFGGWVLTDKDDPDSQQALRYDQFIAPLTKALQETMAELEALKAEVQALKGGN